MQCAILFNHGPHFTGEEVEVQRGRVSEVEEQHTSSTLMTPEPERLVTMCHGFVLAPTFHKRLLFPGPNTEQSIA